jgi:CubicO group peptidase (beta-lactamase class C family)
MQRRPFLTTLGGSLVGLSGLCHAANDQVAPDLTDKLEAIRKKHKVPALATARFGQDGVLKQVATGFRKAGGSRPVTVEDLWHIGSMTKAMTATLLATYVQEGRLQWDDQLGNLIPESCKGAAEDAGKITIIQLLQHRSGLPANLLSWILLPAASQRDAILRMAAPAGGKAMVPGKFLYSNVGYAIAGHIAEKLDGKPWEDLLEARLFKPLGITAGQGPVGTPGSDDQPWPHDSKGQPLPTNGPLSDNPASLGPAGRVHTSMAGYAKFAADHLRGAKGLKALLKPELYQVLHRPDPDSHYACGWGVPTRPWAGGACLTHTGSNTANFFAAWLAPEKAFGVLATCNQGGDAAAAACDAACSLMISAG